MPETKYNRDGERMECLGLDLTRPVDSVKPGKWPYLKNVRSLTFGTIEPRQGLTATGGSIVGQTPFHSCRRLNDPLNATWKRIIGAGTHLGSGQTTIDNEDSGYSGNPLAMVPYRPDQSPGAWMYVADSLRMRKINCARALHQIGLTAPLTAPAVALANTFYKEVEGFDGITGWGATGTAGAPVQLAGAAIPRMATTITRILYDSGTTGWACVQPASMFNIGPGVRMGVEAGGAHPEYAIVQAVMPGSVATTIGGILYDAGSTLECSITLATPAAQIRADSLLWNSTKSEAVRVLAVIIGQDGMTSLRIRTVVTFAAGDTIQAMPSFRAWFEFAHAAAVAIDRSGVRTTVTVGTGQITRTVALDLSLFATGLPALIDDWMHISIRVDRPDLMDEGKVMLDVDSTTNDFTRNFYSRAFRASDLTPSLYGQNLLLTRETILANYIASHTTVTDREKLKKSTVEELATRLDSGSARDRFFARKDLEGIGVDVTKAITETDKQFATQAQLAQVNASAALESQQMEAGDSQWTELKFRLADLIRVGTDQSRTLKNVAVIRIQLVTTGTVKLDVDSWWISGGYGPDVLAATGLPYFYRYRTRVPATGATSNWSPASRGGVIPFRQLVFVTPPTQAAPSGTTLSNGDLVIDIQRFGGEIAAWHYVGTKINDSAAVFWDRYADDVVANLPGEGQNSWQPWPLIDIPRSGTTTSVAGTSVKSAAADFNLLWSPGTEIRIGGIAFAIYQVLTTSLLELTKSAGTLGAVTWRVDEPILLGQPLPCLWGDEGLGTMFACGDVINPGRLYWTNGNNPDATVERNYLDVTSPSEPLMNGVVYNGRSYVLSSERLFQIVADSQGGWRAEEIPGGKGLFARWALVRGPSPILAWLSRDGIYASLGGAPISLTDADLYPLFPNGGQPGKVVNTIPPPLLTSGNAPNLRLEYYDDHLYFDYVSAFGLAIDPVAPGDEIEPEVELPEVEVPPVDPGDPDPEEEEEEEVDPEDVNPEDGEPDPDPEIDVDPEEDPEQEEPDPIDEDVPGGSEQPLDPGDDGELPPQEDPPEEEPPVVEGEDPPEEEEEPEEEPPVETPSPTNTTWFVAKTGNNGNAGTEVSPFLTIRYAISRMAPGDWLNIRTGTYVEGTFGCDSDHIPSGLSWAEATVIQGYPGETVILRPGGGSQILGPNHSEQYIIFRHLVLDAANCEFGIAVARIHGVPNHLRFEDIDVKNATVTGVYLDGDLLQVYDVWSHDNGGVVVVPSGHISPTGNTYYQSLSGSNSDDGSILHPWATLAYAVAQLHAGDWLNIRGGDYHGGGFNSEFVSLRAGTLSNPIRVQAYPGEVVRIFNHDYVAIGMSQNVPYWTFKGLILDTREGPIWDEAHVSSTRSTGIDLGANCRYEDIEVIGPSNNVRRATGIQSQMPSPTGGGNVLLRVKVHGMSSHGIYLYGDNNLVEYCEAYENGVLDGQVNSSVRQDVGFGMQVFIVGGDPAGNIVRKNYFHHNRLTGFEIHGTGTKVYDNVSAQNGWDGFSLWKADVLVDNNVAYGNVGLGLSIWQGVGHTIRNTIFNSNGTNAIFIYPGAGCIEHHNRFTTDPWFTDPGAANFRLQAGSVAIGSGADLSSIFSDDILGNVRTAPWDQGAYMFNVVISSNHGFHVPATNTHLRGGGAYSNADAGLVSEGYNLIEGMEFTTNQGVHGAAGVVTTGPGDVIRNCKSYRNVGDGYSIGLAASALGAALYNNLSALNGGVGLKIAGASTGAVLKNNLSYLNTGAQLSNAGASTTLTANRTTNPGFTNPSGNDFTLAVGGAAIATGVDLSALFGDDIEGLLRTVPWDQGPYKYVP